MNPFKQFMQNPVQALLGAKFKIPTGMTDPNQILNHLLTTGQVSQEQVNKAYNQYRDMNANGQLPTMN